MTSAHQLVAPKHEVRRTEPACASTHSENAATSRRCRTDASLLGSRCVLWRTAVSCVSWAASRSQKVARPSDSTGATKAPVDSSHNCGYSRHASPRTNSTGLGATKHPVVQTRTTSAPPPPFARIWFSLIERQVIHCGATAPRIVGRVLSSESDVLEARQFLAVSLSIVDSPSPRLPTPTDGSRAQSS